MYVYHTAYILTPRGALLLLKAPYSQQQQQQQQQQAQAYSYALEMGSFAE